MTVLIKDERYSQAMQTDEGDNMWKWTCMISLIFTAVSAGAVELTGPENDARFGRRDTVPVFTWQNTDGQDLTYCFELSLDADFSTSALFYVQESRFDLGHYLTETEWAYLAFRAYWRVSINQVQSEIRMFTKTSLVPPRVHFDFDARYGYSESAPMIPWDSVDGAGGYVIEFASDPSFAHGVRVPWETPRLDLSSEIPADVWRTCSCYVYFRVWATDFSGLDGPHYQIFKLSKTVTPPPGIGQPSGRYFGAREDFPEFVWGGHPDFSFYHIQIARDGRWERDPLTYETMGNQLNLGDVMAREEWELMWGSYGWRVAGIERSGAATPWSESTNISKCGGSVITALGDSITTGGVCVPESWVDGMEYSLEQQFGDIVLFNASVGGTKSKWGEEVIEPVLGYSLPEFILLLFGANDSVDPGNCEPPYGCDVAGHLRNMVYSAREFGTVPIISTVLPVNPEGAHNYHQFRVDLYNEEILAMAEEENVHLVDLNAVMWSIGDLPALYCDWGHPNELGNALIAEEFQYAISEYWQ
jgi:lysophospholipase L1-like esterase